MESLLRLICFCCRPPVQTTPMIEFRAPLAEPQHPFQHVDIGEVDESDRKKITPKGYLFVVNESGIDGEQLTITRRLSDI